MKTKMLLLIVFACMYCGFISAQTLPTTDSLFFVMKDGTVHKFDKTKKEDKADSDSIFKNQKDNIKQCYSKDEIGACYTIPDVMPEFKGGQKALLSFVNSNVKYPKEAWKNGVQETIFVRFIIDEAGTVGHTKIVRGKDESLCNEALRVIGALPKWKPGMVGENAVRVAYTMPIKFSLR